MNYNHHVWNYRTAKYAAFQMWRNEFGEGHINAQDGAHIRHEMFDYAEHLWDKVLEEEKLMRGEN